MNIIILYYIIFIMLSGKVADMRDINVWETLAVKE